MAIDNFFAKFAPDDQSTPKREPGFGSSTPVETPSFDALTSDDNSTPGSVEGTEAETTEATVQPSTTSDTLRVRGPSDTVAMRDFGSSLGLRVERLTKKRSMRLAALMISTAVPTLLLLMMSGLGLWSWRSGRLDQFGFQAGEFPTYVSRQYWPDNQRRSFIWARAH